MRRVFNAKALVNKKTKQISICIPKNKIRLFKHKTPKEIKLKIIDVKW